LCGRKRKAKVEGKSFVSFVSFVFVYW
jgi:hypothetical protein